MENREILIANTKTQKRSKITTDATTLAELKAAMTAEGIDYEGMDFTEGISKTHLIDDATQLPHDIKYKGEATNNLVILLTNTKKNVASGEGSRQDAYTLIKANNLQDAVKAKYGKNYTVVPTSDLWAVINISITIPSQPVTEPSPVKPSDAQASSEDIKIADTTSDTSLLSSLFRLLISLEQAEQLSSNELDAFAYKILDYTEFLDKSHDDIEDDEEKEEEEEEPQEPVSTSDGKITDDDIDDMLDDIEF